jgi:hypothetical protein
MPIPKFNYCDVSRQLQVLPIVNSALGQISKYRDSQMGCPIRAMRHRMTNFSIDEKDFSIFSMMTSKDDQNYLLDIKVTDENRKPFKLIVRYEIFVLVTN